MADERPPKLVQLITEYWATDPSDKLIISNDADLWHVNPVKTV
ncbi:hypothetical protein [Lactiplantibacillus pentosus]|nr:hypothetical protein [Lactiplantibacillus pentosus]MDY1546307.1 hypothetical protein [Lactiplantibacillus pentosus]